MAPFRAARSTRSGRQGVQTDFDIIDGLPIRHWHLQEAPVGAEPSVEVVAEQAAASEPANASHPAAWPELQMPRGSNLYAPWCQQLLRAARAGRVQKRKREHEGDDEREDPDEHGPSDELKGGFLAYRWVQLPRQAEEPEPEYLAKRRRGLTKGHPAFINGLATDEVDTHFFDVPEEPVRRRVPPPRRKPKKGPGRKKKIAFTPGEGVSAAADESTSGNGPSGPAPSTAQNDSAKDRTDDAEDDDEDGEEEEDEDEDGAAEGDNLMTSQSQLAEPSASQPHMDVLPTTAENIDAVPAQSMEHGQDQGSAQILAEKESMNSTAASSNAAEAAEPAKLKDEAVADTAQQDGSEGLPMAHAKTETEVTSELQTDQTSDSAGIVHVKPETELSAEPATYSENVSAVKELLQPTETPPHNGRMEAHPVEDAALMAEDETRNDTEKDIKREETVDAQQSKPESPPQNEAPSGAV